MGSPAMRFAYADPPYLGWGRHYDHSSAYEWDNPDRHYALIDNLLEEYPDGWALSASSSSLHTILPMCPADVRVAAWVKPFAVFKPNVNPAYTWEPVVFRGGRRRDRTEPTVRDWLSCNITLRKGLVGAKPPEFCRWVLDLLGYRDGDEIVDLFPGSGVMGVVAGNIPLQSGFFDEVTV
jgi:hypothetical protein